MPKLLVLFFPSLLLAISALLIADFAVGKFFLKNSGNTLSDDFQLPSNTNVTYNMPEFSIKVRTNSQGFRGDKDYLPQKRSGVKRILAVGDSFTYGWGVNLEDSWPNILEKELNKNGGKKYEVFNLGKSGQGPEEYLKTLQKYVSLFKPDLIIVGIVEGDDLSQIIDWPNTERTVSPQTKEAIAEIKRKYLNFIKPGNQFFTGSKNILNKILPHLSALTSKYIEIDTGPQMRKQVQGIIENLSDQELVKFRQIYPEILKIYTDGRLNPLLLSLTMDRPKVFTQILNKDDKKTTEAIWKLSAISSQMKKTAEQNNVQLVFLDIPYGIFISQKSALKQKEMGFDYEENSWNSNVPMEIIKDITQKEDIIFIPSSDYFRSHCHDNCFYPIDGHLTAKGQHILTENMINLLYK